MTRASFEQIDELPLDADLQNEPELIADDQQELVTGESEEKPVFIGEEVLLAGLNVGGIWKNIVANPFPTPYVKSGASITEIKTKIKEDLDDTKKPHYSSVHDMPVEEANERAKNLIDEIHTSDLAKYDTTARYKINRDTWHTSESVKDAINILAEKYAAELKQSQGGVRSDNQVIALAKSLAIDPKFVKKFMTREFGEAYNDSQVLAARAVTEAITRETRRQADELALAYQTGDQTQRQIIEFLSQIDAHRMAMAQWVGVKAEAGRALRMMRGDIGAIGSNPHVPSTLSEQMKRGQPVVSQNRLEELLHSYGDSVDVKQMAIDISQMPNITSINTIVKKSQGGMGRWQRAFVEVYLSSLLSGWKTQVVNILGNSIMTVKGPAEVALAARLGKKMWSGTDQERVMSGEATAMLFGMLNGFSDAFMAAGKAFKTGETYGGVEKWELGTGAHGAISAEAFNRTGFAGAVLDVFGTVIRAPMERMLGPMDSFFTVLNERAAFAQYSFRHAMMQAEKEGLTKEEAMIRLGEIMAQPYTKAPPHMMKDVIDYGLYATLKLPLGEAGKNVQNLMNSTVYLKILGPFVRTPLRLAKASFIEGTPFGLLAPRYQKEMFPQRRPDGSFEPGAIAKSQIAKSRMLFGTSAAMTFAMYAMAGKVTGRGPKDPDARQLWLETNQPYSIKVENDDGTVSWVSYGRVEPVSMSLGAVADIVDAMKMYQWDDLDADNQQKFNDTLGATILSLAEASINKTFTKGLHDMTSALGDWERYGERWMSNMTNNAIPFAGARRDMRKILDPYYREVDGLVDNLMNSTPFFSERLPVGRYIWGDLRKYSDFHQDIWNPNAVKVEGPYDAVDLHLEHLLRDTGEPAVKEIPNRVYGIVELTPQQRDDWIVLSRMMLKKDSLGNFYRPGDPVPEGVKLYTAKEWVGFLMQEQAVGTQKGYWERTAFDMVEHIRAGVKSYDDHGLEMLLEMHPEFAEKVHNVDVNKMRRAMGDQSAAEFLEFRGDSVSF